MGAVLGSMNDSGLSLELPRIDLNMRLVILWAYTFFLMKAHFGPESYGHTYNFAWPSGSACELDSVAAFSVVVLRLNGGYFGVASV